jgi:hypothetical protein
MGTIRTRIRVSADGEISGRAPPEIPVGEHEVTVVLDETAQPVDVPALNRRVREIQDRLARLPLLDARTDEEILGYGEHATFG